MEVCVSKRGLHDVGVGLGMLGVVGRGSGFDEVGHACLLKDQCDFVFLGRCCNEELPAFVAKQLEEGTRAAGGLQAWQLIEEQCAARFTDALGLAAFRIEPDELGENLVASLADQGPELLEGDDVPVRGERAGPCARVRVVAVDERAVDVEQNGLKRVTRGMQRTFHPPAHTQKQCRSK